jgi:hypothetical protein
VDEVSYVAVTAGSFDLLAEVIAESDDQLLDLLSRVLGSALNTNRSRHRTLSLWQETAGDYCAPRPRFLATATPTWWSWVPASRVCGWRTTSLDPRRTCVSRSWIARSRASARRAATGGWCSALFLQSTASLAREHGRQAAARHSVCDARIDRRDRTRRRRRGDRLRLHQWRHD